MLNTSLILAAAEGHHRVRVGQGVPGGGVQGVVGVHVTPAAQRQPGQGTRGGK